MEKKSFVLHYDSLDVLDCLSDEQVGKLLRKMKSYHNGNTYISGDQIVDISFMSFKNQFDRDKIKFNNVCERNSINGLKGGRPKKEEENPENPVGNLETQNNPEKPRKAESDSDSDSDSDSEKDNDMKLFLKESLKIQFEERSVSQHLIVCFYDLGYVPSKDETPESLKEWITNQAKLKQKSASDMIDIINKWHIYWKGDKKPVKNHKASLLNNYAFKNEK